MKHYNKSQIDQGIFLDDIYHVPSALKASFLKVLLLQLSSFLDIGSIKYEICWSGTLKKTQWKTTKSNDGKLRK